MMERRRDNSTIGPTSGFPRGVSVQPVAEYVDRLPRPAGGDIDGLEKGFVCCFLPFRLANDCVQLMKKDKKDSKIFRSGRSGAAGADLLARTVRADQ